MNIIGIIPARMASTRFPGKPLAKIRRIPMIGHVYLRSKMCKKLDDLYVATCDTEIARYVDSIGGKAIKTSNSHQRASDRTREAMAKIERRSKKKVDIVVMVQGDEPMVHPEMIEESIAPMLRHRAIEVVNLMAHLKSKKEQEDPNEIKVVTDGNGFALYFSRAPIPLHRKGITEAPRYKQVCIISFRRDFLIKFNNLKPTPLEIAESIDMLRVLEHGFEVKMVLTKFSTYSVDTNDDLRKVDKLMGKDVLLKRYQKR